VEPGHLVVADVVHHALEAHRPADGHPLDAVVALRLGEADLLPRLAGERRRLWPRLLGADGRRRPGVVPHAQVRYDQEAGDGPPCRACEIRAVRRRLCVLGSRCRASSPLLPLLSLSLLLVVLRRSRRRPPLDFHSACGLSPRLGRFLSSAGGWCWRYVLRVCVRDM
jgi:hypothetical protein